MWKKTKKERRKREAIQFVSVLAKEGNVRKRENEREKENS